MIYKAILTVTVMLEADSAEQAAAELRQDLSGIAYQICDGDWIGSTERGVPIPVPAKKVREELLAIGNDGEFFNAEPWI